MSERAAIDIKDAGGLIAVLRNGHQDATVLIDARRNAADEIERNVAEIAKLRAALCFLKHAVDREGWPAGWGLIRWEVSKCLDVGPTESNQPTTDVREFARTLEQKRP